MTSKMQKCVCGHSIDDHLEDEGDLVIVGECINCGCSCYEEIDPNEV